MHGSNSNLPLGLIVFLHPCGLSPSGSLESINEVLKAMVFVPWCPKWPVPPNWNLPEGSWMDSPIYDAAEVDEDPLSPNIWPQW